jgi:ribosomal protein S26
MKKAGKGKQDMKRGHEEEVQCELGNITENIKLSGPTAVYAIKERIYQKLLRLMNSAAISNEQTALKQLDNNNK